MVPERHRLRGLQMGEARHRVGSVLCGAIGQRAHQRGHLPVQPVQRVADPEAKISRHLVVAAAGGVQTLAGFADALGQPRLDVHVDVFEAGVEGEPPGLDFRPDRREAFADRGLIGRCDDAGTRQHGRMRERPPDVLPPKLAVEPD